MMKSGKGGGVTGQQIDAAADEAGRSPLHLAVQNGHLDVVRLLVEGGADPTLLDSNDETPLSMATAQARRDMLDILIRNASDLAISPFPLVVAAEHGYTEIVQYLVDKGANPAAAEPSGKTPLVAALSKGHTKTVSTLLSLGANPNDGVIPPYIKSPLVASCSKLYGSSEICRMLLEAGANPNAATADGWTPLHQACLDGCVKQIAILMENGADPYQQNSAGKDAFAIIQDRYATSSSCASLIGLLNGEKVDMSDESAIWKEVGRQ